MTEGTAEERKAPKRKRRKKLWIAAAAVAVAAIIIFWGWSATGGRSYLSVAEVVKDPRAIANGTSPYLNRVLEIRGMVTQWFGGSTFVLVDTSNSSISMRIDSTTAIPQGFDNGKSAAVRGQLLQSSTITLIASGITVGCASKY
jgi:cytochrome c-type biogenesis protein CcmE